MRACEVHSQLGCDDGCDEEHPHSHNHACCKPGRGSLELRVLALESAVSETVERIDRLSDELDCLWEAWADE